MARALQNVSKIANKQRPVLTARNDFGPTNMYGLTNPAAMSPLGKGENSSGQVGSSVDIAQRSTLTARNDFNVAQPYTISDTNA